MNQDVSQDATQDASQDASQDATQELSEADALLSPGSTQARLDVRREDEPADEPDTTQPLEASPHVSEDVTTAPPTLPEDETVAARDEVARTRVDEVETKENAPHVDISAVIAGTATRVKAAAGERLASIRANISMPPSPRTMRLIVGICSALLLLALLPALFNASHNNVGAVSAPPTATAVPTATPLPSPTAMPGYEPLVDSEDGFVIQYPLAWTCASSNPGIDCIDSPTEQNYRLQVQLPGSWTGADTGSKDGDASVWVDYALSAFANVPGRTYQRLPDANQTATFGGVTWSSGAALVGIEPDGSNGSTDATATPTPPLVLIRVQVYATVYNSRPYIIALYAANDQFSAGMSRYFQPMLGSFAFLPDSSDS